ncbi:hypothetical protein ACVGOW_20465 [Pseudonocardia saturnea]
MTTIRLYDLGSREPLTSEVPAEVTVKQALRLDDGDALGSV